MKMGLDGELYNSVWQGVETCLAGDDSGHGVDHIERVYDLSMGFCDYYQVVGREVVTLAALLHDVDDYKLVGRDRASQLQNATDIMMGAGIPSDTQVAVRGIVANMGYSKALHGIRPQTLEGKIVSDADMCDAIGANGIIRALLYATSDKGNGRIFDRRIWPKANIAAHEYNAEGLSHDTDGFINHFFEKLLKIQGMMMTVPGRQEAAIRDGLMTDFLQLYFREQGATEWNLLLEEYLASR